MVNNVISSQPLQVVREEEQEATPQHKNRREKCHKFIYFQRKIDLWCKRDSA